MIVGFTCGAFDLCHAGHFLMFKECKSLCDFLIVGLHSDPSIDRPSKNKPIQTIEERLIILNGIKYIDKVITYNTEKELLDTLKIFNSTYPKFHRILKNYFKKTGELAIINTSFNRHEEPIVQDINDALSVLDSNIIKTLIFENYSIKKKISFFFKQNKY